MKTILVHKKKEHEEFSKFAVISYEAGYLAILILLPLLVAAFSIYCTFPILIAEALWLTVFFRDKTCRNDLELFVLDLKGHFHWPSSKAKG